jgi:hypothetical protein
MLIPKRLGRSASPQSSKFQSCKLLVELIDRPAIQIKQSMLSTTRTAAVDFASKGLDTCWGMFFPIDAKNYGNGIGKVTNNLIDHVSDVHKAPTKVNVILIYYLTDK